MIVEQMMKMKRCNFIHFSNFVSLKGATTTLNSLKLVPSAVEGVDIFLIY